MAKDKQGVSKIAKALKRSPGATSVMAAGVVEHAGMNGVCKRKGCDVLLKPTSEDIQPVARKEDRALSRDLLKEMPW
jgi:hypothetical protein